MPKPHQPCSCGSGKKYRDCCQAKDQQRARRVRTAKNAAAWAVVVGIVGLGVYGLVQQSGVAYDENAIGVVNFSVLNEEQKLVALKNANAARCPCGCGLGLAQCVATDATCPIRETNITRIKDMVQAALKE